MKAAVDTVGHRLARAQPRVPSNKHIPDRTAIVFQAWIEESEGFTEMDPKGRCYSFLIAFFRTAVGLTCAASAHRPSMS
jgi:hypothetical protein